jgi:predicted nucleic acid-binding protein
MRLVLDAKVLIAAFVARGVCAELLEHLVREHEPVTSGAILEEVRPNLVARVEVSASQADQTVRLLRTRLEVDLLELVPHGNVAIVPPRGFWRFESQRSRG